MSKARGWCFTVNNYTDEDVSMFENLREEWQVSKILYMVVGKEVGDEGTAHLQGFVRWEGPHDLKWMKKHFHATAHLETARGTDEQNQKYCSKEDPWIEVGTVAKPGARNDLTAVKDAVREGKSLGEMMDTVCTNYQSIRVAEVFLKYKEPMRKWSPTVTWLYGPTNSGKTTKAHEMCGDVEPYVKYGHTGKWWDAYDAHEYVIIDDFRDSHMMMTELLALLDSFACRVENKGGSRQLLSKHIIVTSLFHPEELYKSAKGEPIQQLIRRIDSIVRLAEPAQGWAAQRSGVILDPDQ